MRNSGWIEAKSSHGSSVTKESISMVVRQLYIYHSSVGCHGPGLDKIADPRLYLEVHAQPSTSRFFNSRNHNS